MFAACLDRDTAKIIAFNLQKIARQQGRAVITATTHSDLFEDLAPSVLVYKRFGEEIQINYYPNLAAKECSLISEMRLKKEIEVIGKNSAFSTTEVMVCSPKENFSVST